MKTSFKIEHRLGYRILRWVLSIALVSGIVLSASQIVIDAKRVSTDLDRQAYQTMALVRDAATQAVFSIDEELAQQVVDGLFEQQTVRLARITHPDGQPLGERTRPLQQAPYRPLTDTIFLAERSYRIELSRHQSQPTVYGYLEMHYDTGPTAESWLERATLTFGSGLARAMILALVLFMVYHLLLTKPLLKIIASLAQVDPDHPDTRLITTVKGHTRDELGLWVNATNNLLVAISDSQKKQREAEERVTRLSRFDKLTGLPSREYLLSLLKSAMDDARKQHKVTAVFCCGIDDFKSINDQLGYENGDLILQGIADRLDSGFNDRDFLKARLGSDQFVLVQKQLATGYQAAITAEKLLELFSQPVPAHNRSITLTATIGVALFPNDADELDRLLQYAEQTMTLAKDSGRNSYQFYVASVDQEMRERKQLEKDMARALAENEFHLLYQPQISLDTGRVIGAEALIRWQHPERGLIPPDHFIPLSELNGQIVEIGAWVLDQACRQAAEWAANGLSLRMAVNLSAVQLRQDNILAIVLDTLSRHRIPPGGLELEVTETSVMTNLEDAISKLQLLKREGIQIAVDDFGTGYSSLTYLKRMPVQHLKIDKQFVQDLLVNEDDTRIANTIIDLGKSLNLSVIAEGVETAEQEFYLRQRGCQLAQGYYFSKPLPAQEFVSFVAEFHGKMAENNA
ncbi:putative bifunctional diguanylate cyclase/phosphodiesterase [Marinobacter sp. SS21]|uniref:putative bifunctional diguanylate cyclase/phosphodiesterase n=1 Tax=Marinobacter sp. SS21 TaxID=2979460 RepID=UPI00232C23F9|nr:GGDEF domain-containing phosphodiesterase [Marinobacter sp. SS21]MDC0663853.1 EAL domain-containing protein [Marinobacter sp. SS21]